MKILINWLCHVFPWRVCDKSLSSCFAIIFIFLSLLKIYCDDALRRIFPSKQIKGSPLWLFKVMENWCFPRPWIQVSRSKCYLWSTTLLLAVSSWPDWSHVSWSCGNLVISPWVNLYKGVSKFGVVIAITVSINCLGSFSENGRTL